MFNKKPLKRWFLIAVAILLTVSSITSVYPAKGAVLDSEETPSQAAEFHELFEVDIDPDISDGVGLGEDVVVTVTGRELPDGSQYEIDGDAYVNPGMNRRDVPAMINVTNVLWDGTPWYAEYDDSVWRRNGTSDKYFRRVSPHEVKLTIYGERPNEEGYQFPAGCDVSFNLFVGNKTQDENGTWRNRYVESQEYTYEVGGAWPDKPADYENPDNPDEDLFEKNIKLTREPENPNVRDDVKVNISSRSHVDIDRASLHIKALYPDGELEYYQYLTSDFEPSNESWPSQSATITISGEEWHTDPDTEIEYYLSARDPHGNELVSANQTYVVESVGLWEYPDDFEPNIRLTTDPDISGVDAKVSRTTGVKVTIESRYENVPIENAYLYYHISNTWHGVPQEGQSRMEKESSTEWSYQIPSQNPEVQVDFYVRAWDIGERMIESREYSYSVEEKSDEGGEAPPGKTLFYVTVYDAEIDKQVPEVKVSIGNHSWETTTHTDMSGRCYPNATGNRFTPKYVSVDEMYWIEVYYPHETENETKESVRIEYTPRLPENQNETEVLYDEGNLVVTRVNDTLEFEYNSPPEPPEFAEVYEGYNIYTLISVFVVVGMAVPVGWKLYILTEEGKQERSLVK